MDPESVRIGTARSKGGGISASASFFSTFGIILGAFEIILKSFWDHVDIILGPFGDHFGIILVSLGVTFWILRNLVLEPKL